MDIRQELINDRSKANVEAIARWIGNYPERLDLLMEIYLGKDDQIGQRAAWVMSHCSDEYPETFEPHISILLDQISGKRHAAFRRSAARILTKLTLPEEHWGRAVDICMDRIADVQEPVAIRRFSMEVVWNICQHVPEIGEELRIILEDGMEYGSPGFNNYGRKILKKLNKR